MIRSCFFTSVANNNKGIVNISGIEEELERVLDNYRLLDSKLPLLLSDSIYEISTVIMTQGNRIGLVHVRGNQEWTRQENTQGLGKMLNVYLFRKMSWKLLTLGDQVKYYLFSIFFTLNCYTYIQGNSISIRYLLEPSHLSDYLNTGIAYYYDNPDPNQYAMALL